MSTDDKSARVAIAFDIDGVFKYGREWSADGFAALKSAADAGMQYVFVTNGGGGLDEATYGRHLKEKVVASAAGGATGDIPLPDEQRMVLSYTPWESTICKQYANKKVMIVSDPRDKVMAVAAKYGLTKAVHYQDYAISHPSVNPFRAAKQTGASHTAVANSGSSMPKPGTAKPSNGGGAASKEEPFAAVLVFCDPYEWYEAAQVASDVLCSPTPLSLDYDTMAPPMPIHFSNPDFLSKFEHPFPRYAQGAFRVALKALYQTRLRAHRVPEETIDAKIGASFIQWGKPTDHTFRFVEERLRELAPSQQNDAPERFYKVGDNPASDMEGARRAAIHHAGSTTSWKGVLVRTGVYREGDETNGAAAVVDGVKEAVAWILEQEGLGAGGGDPAAKKQKK